MTDIQMVFHQVSTYRQTSNIRRKKCQNLNVSRFVLQLTSQTIEDMCLVENEDVVGAGDAPTTSE